MFFLWKFLSEPNFKLEYSLDINISPICYECTNMVISGNTEIDSSYINVLCVIYNVNISHSKCCAEQLTPWQFQTWKVYSFILNCGLHS